MNPPELTWFEQASTWLPANWWTWLAGGSLWLAVALVTLPGFFRIRKAGWHQTVSALSLGVFFLSLAPSVGVVTRSNLGIVLENNTLLRLTPTQSAESVATLPPGEPVRELRQRGDYLFVHTQNGDGWVGAPANRISRAGRQVAGKILNWWACSDLNRGPSDYEFGLWLFCSVASNCDWLHICNAFNGL